MTSRADTPSSHARNVRKRAVSSTPAIPITRSRGRPASWKATWHIASSGFVTTITIVSGERCTRLRVTSATIAWFVFSRSSRLMPGVRARPEVMTQMAEPAVSS